MMIEINIWWVLLFILICTDSGADLFLAFLIIWWIAS